jgi:hypothetical protein
MDPVPEAALPKGLSDLVLGGTAPYEKKMGLPVLLEKPGHGLGEKPHVLFRRNPAYESDYERIGGGCRPIVSIAVYLLRKRTPHQRRWE